MNCINLPEFRVIKAEENEFDYESAVQTELELYGLGDIEYKRIQVGRLE